MISSKLIVWSHVIIFTALKNFLAVSTDTLAIFLKSLNQHIWVAKQNKKCLKHIEKNIDKNIDSRNLILLIYIFLFRKKFYVKIHKKKVTFNFALDNWSEDDNIVYKDIKIFTNQLFVNLFVLLISIKLLKLKSYN